jgi:hypothetical protein
MLESRIGTGPWRRESLVWPVLVSFFLNNPMLVTWMCLHAHMGWLFLDWKAWSERGLPLWTKYKYTFSHRASHRFISGTDSESHRRPTRPIVRFVPHRQVLQNRLHQVRIGELFDVRNTKPGFFTYHGFLTIASSSRIISRDTCCLWSYLQVVYTYCCPEPEAPKWQKLG